MIAHSCFLYSGQGFLPALQLRSLALGLLFWLLSPQLLASSFTLDPDATKEVLTPFVEYQLTLEKQSLAEVMAAPESAWAESKQPVLQWGYTPRRAWMRTRVENTSSEPINKLLVMGQPYLDYVDVYVFEREEMIAQYFLGDLRPVKNRPVVNEQFVVPITIPARGSITLYLYADTQGAPLMFNADLWDSSSFEKQYSLKLALSASLISGLLILGLYHLCLSLFLKEKSYAFYASYVLCLVAAVSYALGYLQLLIYPNTPEVNHFFAQLFLSMAMKFSIYFFAIHFLQLKERTPRYYRFIQLLLIFEVLNTLLYGISYAIDFREGMALSRLVNNLNWITHAPVCLIACLFVKSEAKEVRFLVFSWSIISIVLAIVTLSFLGVIPQHQEFYTLLQVTQLSEMLFISFALADRMNQLKIRDIKLEQEKAASARALIEANEQLYESQLRQVQYEHEVKHAQIENQSKSDFLAAMSHEIRTPLNGVLGVTELLQTTTLNGTQRRYVNTIQHSGRGLLSVINDILDFSKISAGEMTLTEEDVNLSKLIDECVELISARTIDKPLAIAAALSPDTPQYIRADEHRLRQILLNVAGNAVKFTQHGTVTIQVSLNTDDTGCQAIQFDIKDSGIGMTQDQVKTIFERYKRVERSDIRKAEGTGLGLPISKELVSLMKGKINVKSTVGLGSHFSIRIPYVEVDIPEELSLYDNNDILVGKRILLIDQPGELRKLSTMNLECWGITHQITENTEQATKILQQAQNSPSPFDAILINHQRQSVDIIPWANALSAITSVPPIIVYNFNGKFDEQEMDELLNAPNIEKVLDCPVTLLMQKQALMETLSEFVDEGTTDLKPQNFNQCYKHLKVLVAEDNPVNQMVIKEQLRQLGIKAALASDGVKAVEAVTKTDHPFDLIIMDCDMPVLDGHGATQQIRMNEQELDRQPTIIIALSAYVGEEAQKKALKSGMNDYLSKPVNIKKLEELVNKFFSEEATKMINP